MNILSALIKCASIGFLAGFLTSADPNLGHQILPLAGLMVLIGTLVALFELTNLELAPAVQAAVQATSVHR